MDRHLTDCREVGDHPAEECDKMYELTAKEWKAELAQTNAELTQAREDYNNACQQLRDAATREAQTIGAWQKDKKAEYLRGLREARDIADGGEKLFDNQESRSAAAWIITRIAALIRHAEEK